MAKIRLITGGGDHWRHRLRRVQRPLYSVDEITVFVCTLLGPVLLICLLNWIK